MSTPLEQITAALDSLTTLEGYAQSGASAEALPVVEQNVGTIRTLLETLQQPLLAQAEKPKPLSAYKAEAYVDVLHIPTGDWIKGYVSSRDAVSGHLHVETEKGPVTVASSRRVRDQQKD